MRSEGSFNVSTLTNLTIIKYKCLHRYQEAFSLLLIDRTRRVGKRTESDLTVVSIEGIVVNLNDLLRYFLACRRGQLLGATRVEQSASCGVGRSHCETRRAE